VLFFNDQEVRFLLSNKGQLLVRGQNFVIRKILPEEVMLEGRIREIRYLEPDQ
jgi:sporulation protein YqfC